MGIVVVFDAVEDDVYEKCENEGGYDQSFADDGHDEEFMRDRRVE